MPKEITQPFAGQIKGERINAQIDGAYSVFGMIEGVGSVSKSANYETLPEGQLAVIIEAFGYLMANPEIGYEGGDPVKVSNDLMDNLLERKAAKEAAIAAAAAAKKAEAEK